MSATSGSESSPPATPPPEQTGTATTSNGLADLSLSSLVERMAAGSVTSTQATQACLERAHKSAGLGAYLQLNDAGALEQAKAADDRRAADQALGPLDGVPVAVKDIFLTQGERTTCGSKILEKFVAPYDGTAIAKLKQAGCVLLGKLNMDEFAMGSSNEHSAFGPVRNPWDPGRVAGGSSGGSAAAAAVGSAFGTLGTDTGGSIRQPAGLCGVVGMKPTYGRVSRYGVIAFASSLDQVGPFGRTVRDVAHLMGAVAGYDPKDATSVEHDVPNFLDGLDRGVKGLRLGVPKEYMSEAVHPSVRAAVSQALDSYAAQGAEIVEVSLPHTDYGIATYYLLATAEASSNLARYDGVRYGLRVEPGVGPDASVGAGAAAADEAGLAAMYERTRQAGFGAEVKRRIMLGTYALSAGYYDAYYRKAQQVRTLVCRDFEAAFAQVDALVTPTTPSPAFALGANTHDPVQMYLADVCTVSANLAGLPGISLPCGFAAGEAGADAGTRAEQPGLPIGLQILGAPWSEALLLQIAHAYEAAHDWHHQRPTAWRSLTQTETQP